MVNSSAEPDELWPNGGKASLNGFRTGEMTRTPLATDMVDGSTTTMALRASFAALVLLGSALSPVSAADAPAFQSTAPAEDPTLPRFEPSQAEFVSIPVVQDVTEAEAEEAEDADVQEIGEGVASWYGPGFAGRKTASGERFNPNAYTAAHRTLPFGSMVRVTRGDRSVVVRINDRGPFHGNRVIDLSKAAADELGLVRAGSGRVSLALVD